MGLKENISGIETQTRAKEEGVMNRKILIAMDESKNAMKAVEYVTDYVGQDFQITLFHVFFKTPRKPVKKDRVLIQHHQVIFKERIADLTAWLEQKRVTVEKVMDKAKAMLVKAGISQKNINIRIEQRKKGVARDILNELKKGKYDTVVVGRRGLSGTKAFFSGSVSNKIVHHAKNCAVWVVD